MTHAAFDNDHRLTTNRIVKRVEGKVTIEVALLMSILGMFSTVKDIIIACRDRMTSITPESTGMSRERSGNYAQLPGMGGKGKAQSESSMEDDDVTIILSPSVLHPHTASLSTGLSSKALLTVDSGGPDDGKVSYSFILNTPTAHTDLERELSPDPLFQAEGINVLSGTTNLFSSDGLTLNLRRWLTF